jgi:Fe-S-cluster containining protein
VLNFIAALFGPRVKLPRDRVSRLPRRARKQAQDHADAMQRIVDEISGLPGIADVVKTKRLPKGFYDRVDDMLSAYDLYIEVVRSELGITDAVQAGTPRGTGACYAAPFGITGPEALAIYREIRTWKDFPQVAQRMAALAEQQFKDIQARHTGGDPEKIRMTSKAAGEGRLAFSQRGEPCPFLDTHKGRCRVWEQRPMTCRMHHITGDPALANPTHERHADVQVVNIRVPVRAQLALSQIDKRMALGLSPFVYASVLQLLQLGDGQLLQEVGEAPQRMQQDGRVVQKANRNVKHAKKFQKQKGKGKKKK